MYYSPPAKSGGSEMIIIMMMMMMMCCFFSVLGAGGWYLTRPEEGDKCDGKDDNGEYQIDEDGKCVLISCDDGYTMSSNGKKCIKNDD
jgi:hypothetical protein